MAITESSIRNAYLRMASRRRTFISQPKIDIHGAYDDLLRDMSWFKNEAQRRQDQNMLRMLDQLEKELTAFVNQYSRSLDEFYEYTEERYGDEA